MADNGKPIKNAQMNFDNLCKTLDDLNWKYKPDREELKILFAVTGEDLMMPMLIRFNTKLDIVSLVSELPFEIKKESRIDVALAVSIINSSIVDGSFDYDILQGKLVFRLTASYKSSLIGKAAFEYMALVSCSTTDKYNDKLKAIAEGTMSIEDLLKFMMEG